MDQETTDFSDFTETQTSPKAKDVPDMSADNSLLHTTPPPSPPPSPPPALPHQQDQEVVDSPSFVTHDEVTSSTKCVTRAEVTSSPTYSLTPVTASLSPKRDGVLQSLHSLQEKMRKLEMERRAAESSLNSLTSQTHLYKSSLHTPLFPPHPHTPQREERIEEEPEEVGEEELEKGEGDRGSEGQTKQCNGHLSPQRKRLSSQLTSAEDRCVLLEKQLRYMRQLVGGAGTSSSPPPPPPPEQQQKQRLFHQEHNNFKNQQQDDDIFTLKQQQHLNYDFTSDNMDSWRFSTADDFYGKFSSTKNRQHQKDLPEDDDYRQRCFSTTDNQQQHQKYFPTEDDHQHQRYFATGDHPQKYFPAGENRHRDLVSAENHWKVDSAGDVGDGDAFPFSAHTNGELDLHTDQLGGTSQRRETSSSNPTQPMTSSSQQQHTSSVNPRPPSSSGVSKKKKRGSCSNGSNKKKKKKKVTTTATTMRGDKGRTPRADNANHYRLNLADIPFVAGRSTAPSHSVGANVQRVLAMMKSHNTALCAANHANGQHAHPNLHSHAHNSNGHAQLTNGNAVHLSNGHHAHSNGHKMASQPKKEKTKGGNSQRSSPNTACSPSSSCSSSAMAQGVDLDLGELLGQLQDEFGQLSLQQQEFLGALQQTTDPLTLRDLHAELDNLMTRMQVKGQQIAKVKQYQQRLQDAQQLHQQPAKRNGVATSNGRGKKGDPSSRPKSAQPTTTTLIPSTTPHPHTHTTGNLRPHSASAGGGSTNNAQQRKEQRQDEGRRQRQQDLHQRPTRRQDQKEKHGTVSAPFLGVLRDMKKLQTTLRKDDLCWE